MRFFHTRNNMQLAQVLKCVCVEHQIKKLRTTKANLESENEELEARLKESETKYKTLVSEKEDLE